VLLPVFAVPPLVFVPEWAEARFEQAERATTRPPCSAGICSNWH